MYYSDNDVHKNECISVILSIFSDCVTYIYILLLIIHSAFLKSLSLFYYISIALCITP